jgi:hypothetical protein
MTRNIAMNYHTRLCSEWIIEKSGMHPTECLGVRRWAEKSGLSSTFVLVVLVFELRALCLQSRCSTT